MSNEYTYGAVVASYDVGPYRDLKLSALLRFQQEAGERQLTSEGYAFGALYEKGLVFLLSRAASVIHRMPRMGDPVFVTTWFRGTEGASFMRCYTLSGEDGQLLAESVSAFVVADARTHRILRPSAFGGMEKAAISTRKNSCPDPEKIILERMRHTGLVPAELRSAELPSAGARPIWYSDVDYNGHLNNTVYADFLCDFCPGGMGDSRVSAFCLNFQGEALEGDVLSIAALEEGNRVFYSGEHARGRCFAAWMERERPVS